MLPYWPRCGCAVGVPKAVYPCLIYRFTIVCVYLFTYLFIYSFIYLSIDLSSVADLILTACGSACAVALACMFCLAQWICQCNAIDLSTKIWSEMGPEMGLEMGPKWVENGVRNDTYRKIAFGSKKSPPRALGDPTGATENNFHASKKYLKSVLHRLRPTC